MWKVKEISQELQGKLHDTDTGWKNQGQHRWIYSSLERGAGLWQLMAASAVATMEQ